MAHKIRCPRCGDKTLAAAASCTSCGSYICGLPRHPEDVVAWVASVTRSEDEARFVAALNVLSDAVSDPVVEGLRIDVEPDQAQEGLHIDLAVDLHGATEHEVVELVLRHRSVTGWIEHIPSRVVVEAGEPEEQARAVVEWVCQAAASIRSRAR